MNIKIGRYKFTARGTGRYAVLFFANGHRLTRRNAASVDEHAAWIQREWDEGGIDPVGIYDTDEREFVIQNITSKREGYVGPKKLDHVGWVKALEKVA